MALTTGTATDYHDLLDKLRLWLTGVDVGWTQLRWTAPASITDTAELWVRGPGGGPDRQTFVGIQSAVDLSLPAHGWAVKGAIAFDSGLAFGDQQGASPSVFLNTWDNSIPYWFYANDRRFIVIAKVSSTYQSLYAGFMLPFALPSEYPFPLYVGASYPSLATFDAPNARNRFIADPGEGAAYYRQRTSATWTMMQNNKSSSGEFNIDGNSDNALMWPMRVPRASSTGSTLDWSSHGLNQLRPTLGNELPVWQVHIIDVGAQTMPGALDGVFVVPGFGRATEQLVTIGSRNFRLFQNVFRSTGRDFMAIEEI